MTPDASIRQATQADAPLLAELVNHAGEGLPLYFWSRLTASDDAAWEFGRSRAARDEGSFSYRNAVVIEEGGEAAGCLIGYAIADQPSVSPDCVPELFSPLQELENLASKSWYVNVLAVAPELRNMGLGAELLRQADDKARALGKPALSLIVSDANLGARRLYERCGYDVVASRPMVKDEWRHEGQEWILMTKPL